MTDAPDPSWSLCLPNFLGDDLTAALRTSCSAASDLHDLDGVEPPSIAIDEALAAFVSQLQALAPVIRSDLGIEHFVVGGVTAGVSRHLHDGRRRDLIVESESHGSPCLAFVYTFGSGGDDAAGGVLRLTDLAEPDADQHHYAPVDDQLVVFPADRHHEIGAWHGPSDRWSISGFVTGAGLHDVPTPADDVAQRLQAAVLPRVTEHGFEVRPMPRALHDLLSSVLEIRGRRSTVEPASPSRGGNSDIVDVQDLSSDILRWLLPLHEQFAGTALIPANIYGIRNYREGNSLAMHLDRSDALVVSSVLQIAQDVDEPWPLVIERDGRRDVVTLEPGQMLLYEGARCLHGRPSPLRGRSFANLFVHYRPHDWQWTQAEIARAGVERGLIDVFGRVTERLPDTGGRTDA